MKIWPHRKTRVLRSFARMAQKDHGRCGCCNSEIKAGEEYECEISVVTFRGKNYIHVFKCHVDCPFHPEDDPDLEVPLIEYSPARAAA